MITLQLHERIQYLARSEPQRFRELAQSEFSRAVGAALHEQWNYEQRYVQASPPYDFYDLREDEVTKKIEQRAKDLLLSLLNTEQQHELEHSNSFVVLSPRGPLRISCCRTNAVHSLIEKRNYCLTVPGVPFYDQMAALKLLIESDPATFFREAIPSTLS